MNAEQFRHMQARLNTNMEAFAVRYEIPTFYDPALFSGWRIAEVGTVSKLFWKREARVHGLALLTLWCDDHLHNIPCRAPYILDSDVAHRVHTALLLRHHRHTLFVDARHVQMLAIRRGHGEILALIAQDSPNLSFLASTFIHREYDDLQDNDEDLLTTEWE